MNKGQKPTPERIEYEKAAKNMRLLDLKAKLSETGIDTSKVPRQKLDKLLRTIETQNSIYRESQAKIQVIQQETQKIINDIAKEGEAIVDSLKKEYGDNHTTHGEPQPPVQKEHEAGCGCSECAGEKPEDNP